MKEVVVVNGVRTAIGTFGSALKDTPVVQLGALVINGVLKKSKLRPLPSEKMLQYAPKPLQGKGVIDLEKKNQDWDASHQGVQVDEVIMGNVVPAGQGQNTARQAITGAVLAHVDDDESLGRVLGVGEHADLHRRHPLLKIQRQLAEVGGAAPDDRASADGLLGFGRMAPAPGIGHRAADGDDAVRYVRDELPEAFDRRAILVDVAALEVVEEAAALAYHAQESPARMVVLDVRLEVVGEAVDVRCQQRNLDFRRPGVAVVPLE